MLHRKKSIAYSFVCLLSLLLSTVSIGICHAAGAPQVEEQQDDDPDVCPPVTRTDLKIIRQARKILNSPSIWNHYDTRNCGADDKKLSLYCALRRATEKVTGHFDHRAAVMQETRFVIEEMAANMDYEHRLMGYNNDPATTFSDIQRVMRVVEQRLEKRVH